LQNFISPTRNIPECNISQAVKLRLKGFSYREIEKPLEFSTSFIAPTHRKYLAGEVAALNLKYPGLKSYLTKEQLSATIQWLSQPKNRNISELKRYLISNYHVIFKSRESYYRIVKVGLLNGQKALEK
jgi:transposase